jgi:hypothetical protein
VRWEVSLLVEGRSVNCFDPKQSCELHLVDLDYVIRHLSDAHEIEVIPVDFADLQGIEQHVEESRVWAALPCEKEGD